MARARIGVLACPPVPTTVARTEAPAWATPDPRADALNDAASAADLAETIAELGHDVEVMWVDEDVDILLREQRPDACVLALHGSRGGSGEVQSLLTLRGIPFTGPGATATALAFDKVRCRQVLTHHNLPVPTTVVLSPGAHTGERALDLLGWPCVLKPRHGSGGAGVTLVDRKQQIEDALDRAMHLDHELLMERAARGQEVQVVLRGSRVLGSMQVERSAADGLQQMMCPPQFGRARLEGMHTLARRAVEAVALGDNALTRVDILASDRHNEQILEVEPLPPLHRGSVVARVANAAGISYRQLVDDMLAPLELASHTPIHSAATAAVLQ